MNMKLFLFIVIFCSDSHASSIRSPDQNRVIYAQNAIRLFQDKTGRLPKSWTELRQINESNTYVKILERDVEDGYKNDFIETFRFIQKDTTIRIRGKSERVVAMGTRSMIRIRPDSFPVKSRLLVVQADKGGIVVRQYNEDTASKLFELAGFDLADFTGSDGKWQPEPEELVASLNGGTEKRPGGYAIPPPEIPNGAATNGHEADGETKIGSRFTVLLPFIIPVSILIPVSLWLIRKKFRNAPSL